MLADLAAWILAAALVGAAVLKLRDPDAGQAALATHGLRRAVSRRAAWGATIAVELALALGVALARGQRGEPCGCLGGRSRVGRLGVVRALALAGACAALPALRGV